MNAHDDHHAAFGHPSGGGREEFGDQLRETMRRAPWWGISLGFHVVLGLVLSNMVWASSTVKEMVALEDWDFASLA